MLDNFYMLVVSVAVIILILTLAFMGWTISKNKDIVSFPTLQNTCPDYWAIEDIGGKPHCVQPNGSENINRGKNIPDTTPGYTAGKFDPNNAGWSSAGNSVCKKKKWASDLGITWDTISNANYC